MSRTAGGTAMRFLCRLSGHSPQPFAGPGIWICGRCGKDLSDPDVSRVEATDTTPRDVPLSGEGAGQ